MPNLPTHETRNKKRTRVNMTKVMVFGTFDIIHDGHKHMLNEAKEYGDYLIAIVARDKTVCAVKGRSPKNDENLRLQNLKKIKIADKVMLGCLGDKYQTIKEERPDIIALGYDQQVFVDELSNNIPETTRIVRLQPYHPEIYKSSKLR